MMNASSWYNKMKGTTDLKKLPNIIKAFEVKLNLRIDPAKTKLSTKFGYLSAKSLIIIVPSETPTK